MATPQQHVYLDPTVGMELTTGDEIALEATRWLFTAGDFLAPARKDDLPTLARGGDELGNFCLRRTHGYLPRCTFTPLEVWAEWLPIEFFPEGVRPLKLKGQSTEDGNPTGRTLVNKPLFGFPHYPGELIVDALGLATGDRKGVVEIEVLRGSDVGSKEANKLIELFWPADYVPPVELRLIEERIHRVADVNKSTDVQSAAKDQLLGCEQFRRWAQAEIDEANTQLDTRQVHQHVYSYSPMIRSLMLQLGITPRQQEGNLNAELLKAVSNNQLTPELLTQFAQMLAAAMKPEPQPPTDEAPKPAKGK